MVTKANAFSFRLKVGWTSTCYLHSWPGRWWPVDVWPHWVHSSLCSQGTALQPTGMAPKIPSLYLDPSQSQMSGPSKVSHTYVQVLTRELLGDRLYQQGELASSQPPASGPWCSAVGTSCPWTTPITSRHFLSSPLSPSSPPLFFSPLLSLPPSPLTG